MAGAGFDARDLTIRNTVGPAAQQAVALHVDSDRSALFRVAVEGHQDTLYAHSLRQFYRDCRVSGTCLLYTSPSPRDGLLSRMPSSA